MLSITQQTGFREDLAYLQIRLGGLHAHLMEQWSALPYVGNLPIWTGGVLVLCIMLVFVAIARKARRRRKTAAGGEPEERFDSVAGYIAGGVIAVILLVGGLGGWAATTEIAGAVIAQGTVVVDSNVKKVQHSTGGVVGEIRVKDGDRVRAGDLLLRLDETVPRANLQVITKQLDELAMRQARLVAERDNTKRVDIPRLLRGREDEAEVAAMIAGELSLFESRRSGRANQKAQLRERIVQLGEEIKGLSGQHAAKSRETELVRRELEGLERLEGRQLTTTSRMTVTRRDVARLEGERSQLAASIAQAKGRISEIELQILQIDLGDRQRRRLARRWLPQRMVRSLRSSLGQEPLHALSCDDAGTGLGGRVAKPITSWPNSLSY